MRPSSLPDPVAQGLLLSKSNETISPARRAAFEILRRVELENAYASVLLAALGKPMREDDRALCHELVLGVLRRRLWLDRALGLMALQVGDVELQKFPIRFLSPSSRRLPDSGRAGYPKTVASPGPDVFRRDGDDT